MVPARKWSLSAEFMTLHDDAAQRLEAAARDVAADARGLESVPRMPVLCVVSPTSSASP